jgi:hypothetical protein
MANNPNRIRIQVEWERLARKKTFVSKKNQEITAPSPNLDRLALMHGTRVTSQPSWQSNEWRRLALQALNAPLHDRKLAARACIASLAIACSQGNPAALREALNDEVFMLADNSPALPLLSCISLMSEAQVNEGTPDAPRRKETLGDQTLIHALAEALALGHKVLDKPLISWLDSICASYTSQSAHFLPEQWPPTTGAAHGLRSIINTFSKNQCFMQNLFRLPTHYFLKKAHQQKIIDRYGLHEFAMICAKSAAIDPQLFSHLLGQGLDALRPSALAANERAYYIISGVVKTRDLPTSIEFGLASWIHSPSGRSHHNARQDEAQNMLAHTLSTRIIKPSLDEAIQTRGEAQTGFRAALSCQIEALDIAKITHEAGGSLKSAKPKTQNNEVDLVKRSRPRI